MITLNLLNPKTGFRRSQSAKAALLCIAVLSSTGFATLLCWYSLLQSEFEKCTFLKSKLAEENLDLNRTEALIVQNQEKQQELDRQLTALRKLVDRRYTPHKVLGVVTDSLPINPRLSLTRLAHTENKVHLSGRSLDFNTMTSWIMQLETSSVFEAVNLNRWQANREVFLFEIVCVLKE